MRGGADTQEKMGHEHGRVSKATGHVLSFSTQCTLSSQPASAVPHVLHSAATVVELEPGVSDKKMKDSWCITHMQSYSYKCQLVSLEAAFLFKSALWLLVKLV